MGNDWGQSSEVPTVQGWRLKSWMPDAEIPMPLDRLRGLVAELLGGVPEPDALAIVTRGEMSGSLHNHDNWNGGTYTWRIEIGIRPAWYGKLPDVEHLTNVITAAANAVLRAMDNHSVDVVLTPKGAEDPDWQAKAERLLNGEGVSNQGRVRSDNVAAIEEDGLLFRSRPEVNFYRALKESGVVFAPLAVFVQGGRSYTRLEPDFIIFKGGRSMVVELDGDTFHHETPLRAHKRLVPLTDEGVKVERFDASQCGTLDGARQCVKEVVAKLDVFSKQR